MGCEMHQTQLPSLRALECRFLKFADWWAGGPQGDLVSSISSSGAFDFKCKNQRCSGLGSNNQYVFFLATTRLMYHPSVCLHFKAIAYQHWHGESSGLFCEFWLQLKQVVFVLQICRAVFTHCWGIVTAVLLHSVSHVWVWSLTCSRYWMPLLWPIVWTSIQVANQVSHFTL